MTIQEAINSGKPFRHAQMTKDEGWYAHGSRTSFMIDEVLRTDWEIKIDPREWIAFVSANGFLSSGHSQVISNLDDKRWIKVREVIE